MEGVASLDAIFFDIDDTLYSTTEFARRAREASVDAMIAHGVQATREELLAELDEVVKEFSSNYDRHFDKLLQRLPRRATRGVNPSLVVAAGVVAYHETKQRELRPYPDAIALLDALKGAGPLVGIITDGIAVKQAEKIVRLKVLPYVAAHAVYISDAVGINKPNPKLYLRACADLNLRPSSVMIVGDNPRNDVDPPNRLGMVTVRVRRSGGKYKDQEGETQARYTIERFDELRLVLARDFGLFGERREPAEGASTTTPPVAAASS
jgi:putative hydrolase of the HAD superfamily